jgi:hypothetical protein
MKPYSKNKFDYNWHWFWDTGNGDIGNQGAHEMDIALWGLGRSDWPKHVVSTGGKFIWKDDQETPNTQQASFVWDDAEMTFDVRNLCSAARSQLRRQHFLRRSWLHGARRRRVPGFQEHGRKLRRSTRCRRR